MSKRNGSGGQLHPTQARIARLSGTDTPIGFADVYKAELIDVTGVPINSDRSALPVVDKIDWLYRPSTFKASPSRTGQDKPISGLELFRLGHNIGRLTSIALYLRDNFWGSGEVMDFSSSVALASMIKYLPHYLVFRREKPLAHDKLPVELAVCHNAATGALSGLFNRHDETEGARGNIEYIPNPTRIAETVERSGRLVGDKTVCVARPEIISGFLTTIVQGRGNKDSLDWLEEWLPPEEVQTLAEFAMAAFMCETEYRGIQYRDHELAYALRQGVEDPWERIAAFKEAILPNLAKIMESQPQMNLHLGRVPGSPLVDLNNNRDFHLPSVLRRMLSSARKPVGGSKRKRKR